jgi:hypothetical protein
VTRTIISIIIAKLDGTIVKAIVERKQVADLSSYR